MVSPRCATSRYSGKVHGHTHSPQPTSGFWTGWSMRNKQFGAPIFIPAAESRGGIDDLLPVLADFGSKRSGNHHTLYLDRDANGSSASARDGAEDCRKSTNSQRQGSR